MTASDGPRRSAASGAACMAWLAVAGLAHGQMAVRTEVAAGSGWAVVSLAGTPLLPRGMHRGDAAARVVLDPGMGRQGAGYLITSPESPGSGEALLVTPRSAGSGLAVLRQVIPLASRTVRGPLEVRGGGATFTFDPAREGGLPAQIRYLRAGSSEDSVISAYAWNDRVYHAERGGWSLRYDREPRIVALVETPELTVVRVKARYCRPDGVPDPGGAHAVYDWIISAETPHVLVRSYVRQGTLRPWQELHHLEFNVSDDRYNAWLGGEPLQHGPLRADRKGWVTRRWGALLEEPAAGRGGERLVFAIIAPEVRFYDGRGEYGTYVHGAWESWDAASRTFTAWLWVGTSADPARDVGKAAAAAVVGRAYVTTVALEKRLAAIERTRTRVWEAAVARYYVRIGRFDMAQRLVGKAERGVTAEPTAGPVTVASGDARLTLHVGAAGASVVSLFDVGRRQELADTKQPPLFRIVLRSAADGSDEAITSDAGWSRVTCQQLAGSDPNRDGTSGLRLTFAGPTDPRFRGISVTVTARPVAGGNGWKWTLRADNSNADWGIEKVAFPQVRVAVPGPPASAFYPTGAGIVRSVSPSSSFRNESLYPNGWCTMQYMAAYGGGTGLYYGLHDPDASVKYLVQEKEQDGGLVMSFDVPAANMGKAGARFLWPGEAVWQLLRGDWYDAAQIYRQWVRRYARWFPELGPRGRRDTPEWMKTLCAWAQTGGSPTECVAAVKRMQAALGVPIGFHWYNWHQIPFDNDYPHYFPTREGVPEAVADLQRNQVYVMPYINGRLWDTRDRGAEDFEFTSRALPAATKQRSGEPYVESYGSKESDGSPVRLAVMCPATPRWQHTVRSIVLRLMKEVGTKAVYIDQIAAAPPVLCMDPSHGHPLGGGSWWTVGGYWPLLRALRAQMPADRMITTECAAEAYAAFVDGFLSWEWQYEGMVPALPAVYGGAVQYFGRNYGAGATTRDLALCMKMGQQLVFGEQIGWLDPRIATEPVAGAFLRLVVRTRHRFVDYFARGEMARPPRLSGTVPTVRADWAWYGETWVTTPAVLTAAWRLPADCKLLLLFVNVSDRRVTVGCPWDPASYGVRGRTVRCSVLRDPDAESEAVQPPSKRTTLQLELPARSLQAWELAW